MRIRPVSSLLVFLACLVSLSMAIWPMAYFPCLELCQSQRADTRT